MEVLRGAYLLCFTIAILSVSRAVVDEELNRRCQAQTNCSECIQESPDCVWCADDNIPDDSRRCNAVDPENRDSIMCTDIQDPVSRVTGMSNDNFENFNQIVPRRIDVSVRPGTPITFELAVQPANNFPIDLYLLMDLSASMNDDLDNLQNLGTSIAESIRGISDNFRIGFGSFVDKVLASFVSINTNRLVNPCSDMFCLTPYSYRHVISLTNDEDLFADMIRQQMISGNQDFPEGGFDGFLQSIVCTDFIGWRNVSRKLLLYISDAGFHFAGDGLLGGVVAPNDGTCRMNGLSPDPITNTIDYPDYNIQDYPSIGQITEKLEQFDIIPIFAVTSGFTTLYDDLRDEIGERAYTGTLEADSGNVVTLVEQLYREISQRIVFSPPNIPGVVVNVVPRDCSAGRIIDGVCSEVNIEEMVTFSVTVSVTECTPQLMEGPQDLVVSVIGFGSFTVNLTAFCLCDCDAFVVPNAFECNGQGDFVCGICNCNPGYFGDRCQCDSTGLQNGMNININCLRGLNNQECSGRGICTCGVCECRREPNGEERFYGVACECDNTVCEIGRNGEICSGPNQGECTCDGCRCLIEPTTGLPYNMSDCSCTPVTQTCRDPGNSTDLCNGRGSCMCGECQCRPPYFGAYCELCSGDEVCQLNTCDVRGDNARCTSCAVDLLQDIFNAGIREIFSEEFVDRATQNGTLPEGSMFMMDGDQLSIRLPDSFVADCRMEEGIACPGLVIINQTTELDYMIDIFSTTLCFFTEDGCTYRYFVGFNTTSLGMLPIHVEYPPACTAASRSNRFRLAIPPWAIALILVAILIIIGIIALILLKVLLMILDWIELQKFEKELAKIKYTKQNENPLYHSASKDYKNPIYGH